MRYYVVADVHGYYSILMKTLTKNGYFEDKSPKKLVICGDFLDRGSEAKKTENFICELLAKNEIILIRGNHEDLFEDFLFNIWSYSQLGFCFSHHYPNGTINSCLQLTDMSFDECEQYVESFAQKIRQTNFYNIILPQTIDYFETEHYIFTHGYIPCLVQEKNKYIYQKDWRNADGKSWEKARWCNGMLANHYGVIEPNKTIVCGHFHCSYGHSKFEKKGDEFTKNSDFSPYVANGIIAIDACTAFSGKMNLLIIDD